MVLDSGEDYMTQELDKHKKKLREISSALETQHQLLRLIVQVNFDFYISSFSYYFLIIIPFSQKMEIKTEADDVDEGVSSTDLQPLIGTANKWTSPRIRKKLRSVISFTKGHMNR